MMQMPLLENKVNNTFDEEEEIEEEDNDHEDDFVGEVEEVRAISKNNEEKLFD